MNGSFRSRSRKRSFAKTANNGWLCRTVDHGTGPASCRGEGTVRFGGGRLVPSPVSDGLGLDSWYRGRRVLKQILKCCL